MRIPLKHSLMHEARPRCPQRQSSGSGEQLQRLHCFSSRNFLNLSSNFSSLPNWNSQMTKTLQPDFRKSRTRFPFNLGSQKSKRDFGKCANLQRFAGCRCQKQPLTEMAFFLGEKRGRAFPANSPSGVDTGNPSREPIDERPFPVLYPDSEFAPSVHRGHGEKESPLHNHNP